MPVQVTLQKLGTVFSVTFTCWLGEISVQSFSTATFRERANNKKHKLSQVCHWFSNFIMIYIYMRNLETLGVKLEFREFIA